jgi:formamidopyrimidine-DNA glycosylase
MPELPDLTLYLEALEARVVGVEFEGLELASPFVLRTVTPPAAELAGRKVVGLRRLGKRIVFALEGERFIVLHLMIAGRLQFRPAFAGATSRSSGKSAAVRNRIATFTFSSGALFLTEAGKKRRAAIHLVRGEADLAAHDPGGIEPLSAGFDDFRRALGAENHTLKRALTDPHLVAGIGNAYSDEILHAARLSPFARTGDLAEEGWQRLYDATRETLTVWIDRLRKEFAGEFPARVTAFRPEMAVHGRYGQPCPVCGTAVQRIVYAENEANYCPTCQTGGKLLADRVLSRLLHGDWPKSLEALEEKKSAARAAASAGTHLAGVLALTFLLGSAPAAAIADAGAGAGPSSSDLPRPIEPPLGRAVVPPRPLPALPPDPVRLEEARTLLGEGRPAAPEQSLGGYLLLTDLEDPALVARAMAVVSGLEVLYFERYGRPPVGEPREAIVLFESEADYRRFQAGEPRLAGIGGTTGLASRGLVATFRGERSDDELLGTLVHELGHLLNRRALGPSLPSWLDEGLADDLGASRIDREGRLLPGSWSRTLDAQEREIRISGGEAALRDLAELFAPAETKPGKSQDLAAATDAASRIDLGAMLALEWEEFVAEEGAELHYAAATAFIRMLLAAPASSGLFRDWLTSVAAGSSPAAEDLRMKLGRSWPELERALALWSRAELARLPALRSQADESISRSPAGSSAPFSARRARKL